MSEAKKIERQRQLDLLFLAGPKDFHPGEAQGASVASTMSVKLGVGVSQGRANIIEERAKHVPDKEQKSCGEAVALLRYKEDFVQQNRHSTTPKTVSFHDEKSIILKK